jgi:hypothetical protein
MRQCARSSSGCREPSLALGRTSFAGSKRRRRVTDVLQRVPKAVERGEDGIAHFDAIVVGAGVAGLYQLYSLLQAGLSVRCS